MATPHQSGIADFTSHFKEFLEPNRRMAASWLLSSDLRLKFVFAIAPRLSLAFFCQLVKRPNLVVGAVSGEEAALGYIAEANPGMLICTDLLEQGDGFSLVRRARAKVADLRVVMVMQSSSPDVRQARALKIEGIFCNADIGRPGASGMQAVIAACMGRNYLSPEAERHLLAQGGADGEPTHPEADTAGGGDPGIDHPGMLRSADCRTTPTHLRNCPHLRQDSAPQVGGEESDGAGGPLHELVAGAPQLSRLPPTARGAHWCPSQPGRVGGPDPGHRTHEQRRRESTASIGDSAQNQG